MVQVEKWNSCIVNFNFVISVPQEKADIVWEVEIAVAIILSLTHYLSLYCLLCLSLSLSHTTFLSVF